METQDSPRKKEDGFRDEQYYIIPTESFRNYVDHPMIRALYLTDVGFFPHALHHYRERDEGCDEYILLYCTRGEGYVHVGEKKYTVREEEAFCIPRNVRHRYYASDSDPWSIFWVHFKGENTRHFPLDRCQVTPLPSRPANNRMMFLFDLLFRVLERNYTEGNFIYISQVLTLILAEVYHREKGDATSMQNQHITVIVRYMYKHIHESLSLDSLSQEFALSKSYLNAIFKKHTRRAPIDFFINLKMQEACKMLKSTDLLVSEVSAQLGYDDPFYFSRIFKKNVGLTPKEYKRAEYIPLQ